MNTFILNLQKKKKRLLQKIYVLRVRIKIVNINIHQNIMLTCILDSLILRLYKRNKNFD